MLNPAFSQRAEGEEDRRGMPLRAVAQPHLSLSGYGGQGVAGGRRCVKLLQSIGYELFSHASFDYTFVITDTPEMAQLVARDDAD